MSYEKFKTDNGETKITITEGTFKGYVIIVRTAVSNVVFEGKYEDKDNKIPEFRITHHDSFVVIPPQVDIRKQMK